MPASAARRPLPALAFLLALSVLTGVVWWRVLHRADGSTHTPVAISTPTSTCTPKPGHVTLPQPGAVSVTVLNAANRTGLAATVEAQLKSRGFATAGVGNDTPFGGIAEIRYGAAGKPGAQLLSYYVPGAKLMVVKRSSAMVDVVLGTAFKSLASNNVALAAAKKAGAAC